MTVTVAVGAAAELVVAGVDGGGSGIDIIVGAAVVDNPEDDPDEDTGGDDALGDNTSGDNTDVDDTGADDAGTEPIEAAVVPLETTSDDEAPGEPTDAPGKLAVQAAVQAVAASINPAASGRKRRPRACSVTYGRSSPPTSPG